MHGNLIRVLLADDHIVDWSSRKAALGGAKDMTVVGEAATGSQAIAMAERYDPDVVVMDLDLLNGDGLEATKTIVAKGPRPRVLVLTRHVEEERLLPMLQAGAAGYLVKSATDRGSSTPCEPSRTGMSSCDPQGRQCSHADLSRGV